MFDPKQITITDIKSTPLPGLQYIANNASYKNTFEKYNPKEDSITKIRTWLNEKDELIQLVAFGASWCPDCIRNIPQLVKIVQSVDDSKITIGILSNIKTKLPQYRAKGEPIWKSPPSPPETIDKRFDISHIPLIFIFNKKGDCIGRIVENPQHFSTLEEEIVYHIEN